MMHSQEERVKREKAALEYEAKKDRALDFASSLGVVVAVRMLLLVYACEVQCTFEFAFLGLPTL